MFNLDLGLPTFYIVDAYGFLTTKTGIDLNYLFCDNSEQQNDKGELELL